MSKLSFALAALVAVPLLTTTAAQADTKALTAAQKTLGTGSNVIIGINVASITSSKLFQTMWPALVAKGGADMKDGMDLAKNECGMDPLKAVSDVVIAMDQKNKKGVIYIGFADKTDQAKIETCVTKIGAKKGKPVPTFKKTGNVVEVTSTEKGHEGEKKYYSWVTADVIAMSIGDKNMTGDKAALATWTGGKGIDAKSGVGALVAKTSTSGAAWGAATIAQTLQPGMDVKGGYGSVAMTGGNLNVDVHAVMADAKQATSAADMANKQIKAVTSSKGASLPPAISKALAGVAITAAGSEVGVKASMTETDVQTLLGLLMMSM